ncbi:hypothetical protein [Polyangium mundeleinium]|uniref:Tetratricopeptide repeat protein n=1 Tax=Polyangium mundeleinium TaxID=2995306 RepID=A0ABT5EWR3_9BACT|nr:hypothetical protein [Polyangium mundeleinium]MDC0745814.1 hypothetical protein [Polyangium mundeleinium]
MVHGKRLMTHSPPQLCFYCREKEATAPYVHAGIDEVVCSVCLKRLTARDALEDRLMEIVTLASQGRYDDALACLNEIFEANRHLDDDQWLARSIAMHRCAILVDAERFTEAEQACRAWAALGFETVDARWLQASYLAQALDALGRPREALGVLEEALGHRDPRYLPLARGLLRQLAELSEELDQIVAPEWRHLAEAVARRFRVELPVADMLADSIIGLAKTTRDLRPASLDEWEKDEGKTSAP